MGIAYNTSIVRNGLVLHLDAANTKSYPGSGTTLYDLSAGKRNSTLVGAPSYSNGYFSFDGTAKYIETPRIPDTGTATASLTWSVWCAPATTGNGDIINMRNGSGWDMCPIYSTGQKFYGRVWSSNGLESLSTYVVNTYYYLVLVYEHSATNKMRFYVNGVLQATNTATYNASGQADGNFLYFGRAGNQATLTHFNGKISNALIYNRALSDAEIKQNFEALRGRYGI